MACIPEDHRMPTRQELSHKTKDDWRNDVAAMLPIMSLTLNSTTCHSPSLWQSRANSLSRFSFGCSPRQMVSHTAVDAEPRSVAAADNVVRILGKTERGDGGAVTDASAIPPNDGSML